MKYRLKVANLSRGMDLAGVQSDLDELKKVYLESEPYLGKLTDEKKNSVCKSVDYVKGLVEVNAEYFRDHGINPMAPAPFILQIA